MQQVVGRLALRKIVSVVAEQLEAMGREGKAIEDVVGDIIRNGQVSGNGLKETLQGLDHMVQIIDELAIFLNNIKLQVDPDIDLDIEDAAKRLKLRELCIALGCQPPQSDGPGSMHRAGDVDFF
jgi:hypothetical protein